MIPAILKVFPLVSAMGSSELSLNFPLFLQDKGLLLFQDRPAISLLGSAATCPSLQTCSFSLFFEAPDSQTYQNPGLLRAQAPNDCSTLAQQNQLLYLFPLYSPFPFNLVYLNLLVSLIFNSEYILSSVLLKCYCSTSVLKYYCTAVLIWFIFTIR